MQKSTIFFAGLSLLLAALTGGVLARLWAAPAGFEGGAVDTSLDIGLPGGGSKWASDIVQARSTLLWNVAAGVIEKEHNGFARQPIASLTKIMTAMVLLDFGIDWEQQVTIEPHEYVIGGRLLLHPGETATMRDLWHASLMGSANNATLAMVRGAGVPETEFVQAMNRKAIALGLEQTEFSDVTGLDTDNVSTAYEMARLLEAGLRDYPAIAEATSRVDYEFIVGGSGRQHLLRNTNQLATEAHWSIRGGKTGYLYEAGYCLITQGGEGGNFIAVVLGAESEEASVQQVQDLLQSGYGGV